MSQPYIGEIRMVGFNFAPVGWMFCNGSVLPISQYDALFSLIGTTYGGDGQQTFALPNLQSRAPVHMGTSTGTNVLGQTGGVESVTLTTQQLPGHTHNPQCNSTAANSANPAGNYWANWADQQFSDQALVPAGNMSAMAVGSAGGGQPHDNMIPYLVINFIISLFGVYPSQN
jgi:microcystin-dependent protein